MGLKSIAFQTRISIHGIDQPDPLPESGPGKRLEPDRIERGFFVGRRTFTVEQIINDLREAEVLIEGWRKEYSHIRPHTSLRYRPPAPEAIRPVCITSGPTFQVVQESGAGHQ